MLAPNALAEAAGVSLAQIQPMDRFEAEQARLLRLTEGKPRAYEDKVMDPSTLPPQPTDAGDAPPDARGMGLRSYAMEGRYGFAQNNTTGYGSRSANEWGLRTEYRLETMNYGEFLVQADGRARSGDEFLNTGSLGYAATSSSGRLTLRNLGFPVTPSIFADTTAGDMYSDVADAFRRSYRLSLGSSTVRGLATRVYGRNFDLTAGVGDRGNLAGGPFAGFERSSGSLAWAGYSQRFNEKLFAGLQFNQANNIPAYMLGAYFPVGELKDNATSVAAAVGYGHDLFSDDDKRIRLTLVHSQTTADLAGRDKNAHGAFLEGGFRIQGYRNELGVYSTSPNLRFGDTLVSSDNRGAYWRVDHSTSRLSWGAGLDYEQYNPAHDPARYASHQTGINANAQYRLDRNSSIGISSSLSSLRYDGGAYSSTGGARTLYASGFYQTRFYDWGASRLRITARRNQALVTNDVAATGEEMEWEQDWITGKYETMRPELTTTLGWARDRSGGDTQTYPTAGVVLRHWFDSDWSVGGNLRYTSRSGNLSTSRGLSGSLNTEAVLSGGWRVGAALQLNQATINTNIPNGISSMPTAQVSRSNDKSAYIYLRWDGSDGTSLQNAGARNPGSAGGGGISGVVYFDVNRDGEQQVGENGVPNVEVILDGRYRVNTDGAGRFEFPMVATGSHRLTLRLESVPLPWGAALDRGLSIEVPLRGLAHTRIPVVRVGGE